jgi:hypothetical protein
MMEVVRRFLKVVVLLLVVGAVTTILLTPSPSDDVPGVMHRHRSPVAMSATVDLLQVASLIKSNHLPQDIFNRLLLPANFLELVCQHLC